MNKLVRCEPTKLPITDGNTTLSSSLMLYQGGLVEGKPTVVIEVERPDGRTVVEGRYFVSELRQSLDILEPAPKKRERKRKKAKVDLKEILGRPLTPEGGFRG